MPSTHLFLVTTDADLLKIPLNKFNLQKVNEYRSQSSHLWGAI